MSNENDDLFDDQPVSQGEGESKTFDEPSKPEPSENDDKGVEEQKQVEETGDKEEGTAPPTDTKEDVQVQKTEKMIPESRFKAALKDATEKLEVTQAELAKFKAVPIPDRDSDPEGYDLHYRIETSKAAVREVYPDYQDVIVHYNEMVKTNPLLNEAVAKHPAPAKYAYDLAKEDMRISRLRELETSDEYKQFLEWKKGNKNPPVQNSQIPNDVGNKLAQGAPKVPNLNRATNVARAVQKSEVDEELFAGAL